jgi:hypothetical protein
MRLALIARVKTRAVIFHDDLGAGIRTPGPDGDMQRIGIEIQAMLDGVFHNGL